MNKREVADYLYKEAWRRSGEPVSLVTDSFAKLLTFNGRNVSHHAFCSFPIVVEGEVTIWSVEQIIFNDEDILDIEFWMSVVKKMDRRMEDEQN